MAATAYPPWLADPGDRAERHGRVCRPGHRKPIGPPSAVRGSFVGVALVVIVITALRLAHVQGLLERRGESL